MLWLALTAALQDAVDLKSGATRTGAIVYEARGLNVGGAAIAWGEIAGFRDGVDAPEPAAGDAAEFEKRRGAAKSAKDFCALGAWARSRRLAKLADEAFNEAIKIDPDHADARAALAFAKTDAGWRPATEVLESRRKEIADDDLRKLVDLASWCGKNGLPAQREQILVDVLAKDGGHKGAVTLLRPLLADRAQDASLRPPLAGRVWAAPDVTKHHQARPASMYAIDFFKVDDDGLPYRGKGKQNEDYVGWDEPVYAAADGEVVCALGDFPDMTPGTYGKFSEANTVTIRHAGGDVTDYGHLRRGSLTVKVGDAVKRGQVVGRVGNSGATGSPHLHFTLLTKRRTSADQPLWVGVPFAFDDFTLLRVDSTPAKIAVKRAVMHEGWTFLAPKPE